MPLNVGNNSGPWFWQCRTLDSLIGLMVDELEADTACNASCIESIKSATVRLNRIQSELQTRLDESARKIASD